MIHWTRVPGTSSNILIILAVLAVYISLLLFKLHYISVYISGVSTMKITF